MGKQEIAALDIPLYEPVTQNPGQVLDLAS